MKKSGPRGTSRDRSLIGGLVSGGKSLFSATNHRFGGSPSDTMLWRTEEVVGPSGSFPSSHNDKDYNEEEPK